MGLQSSYRKLETIVHLFKSAEIWELCPSEIAKVRVPGFSDKDAFLDGRRQRLDEDHGHQRADGQERPEKGRCWGHFGVSTEQGTCDEIVFNVSLKEGNNET